MPNCVHRLLSLAECCRGKDGRELQKVVETLTLSKCKVCRDAARIPTDLTTLATAANEAVAQTRIHRVSYIRFVNQ